MIKIACISLRSIDLVWPTRLIFLAEEEVLCDGFNFAVVYIPKEQGTYFYCCLAIKDKKMTFIHAQVYFVYIMSYFLRYYSVLS
mgnify:CR=1 FL=1